MIDKSDASGGSGSGPPRIVSFISRTSGSGRSGAVANVAWILARAGRRVVVIEWGARSSGVNGYLQPFAFVERSVAQDRGEQVDRWLSSLWTPANDHDRATPPAHLYRYTLPEGGQQLDVVRPAHDLPDLGAHEYGGGGAGLREALRGLGYDHVLINYPSDLAHVAVARLAPLSDVGVVCFLPNERAIREAGEIARQLRGRAAGTLDILAVAARFDPHDQRLVQHLRSTIFQEFAGVFTGPGASAPAGITRNVIEVPYRAYEMYDPVLVVLADESVPAVGDQPGAASSPLAAYEQLTDAVSAGAVTRLVPVREQVRVRYRHVLGLGAAPQPETVYLAYAAEQRPWADWVTAELGLIGLRTERLPRDGAVARSPLGASVLVIQSMTSTPVVPSAPAADAPGSDAPGSDAPGSDAPGSDAPLNLIYLQISADPAAAEPPAGARVIDVSGHVQDEATSRLRAHFGPVRTVARQGARDAVSRLVPRFPRGLHHPLAIGLSARNPGFVGRDDELEMLRDQLLAADGAHPWTAYGGPGVGKSELAREYAHRFQYDYDVVCWVPAHDRQSVQASLTRLAAKVAAKVTGEEAPTARTVLAQLSADQPSARWLLIYDNVDDHHILADLLPAGGHGHVLITSRTAPPAPSDTIDRAAVQPLRSGDSVALLRRRMPAIAAQDAEAVAARVGHLPLAVQLATAWLAQRTAALRSQGIAESTAVASAVQEFQRELAGEQAARRGRRGSGSGPDVVVCTLAVTAKTLESKALESTDPFGRLAVRLAQLCAFLSPTGVSLALLRSAPMLSQLIAAAGTDGELLAADSVEFDRVLWTGVRYGLFEVAWGRPALLRMHRVVQDLIREGMPTAQCEERQAQVLRGLAGYAPTDAEDEGEPDHQARLDELARHLEPSGALHSRAHAVRRWVVSQVRHSYRRGGTEAKRSAVELAEQVRRRWRNDRPGTVDELGLRLNGQLANLYRALGRHREAHALDEEALLQQRATLGLGHLRTLITGRGMGGDLRDLGRYDEALVEDHATHEGFRQAVGDDHPDTLMAANNLASSSFLAGDARSALALALDVHTRRVRLIGWAAPETWRSASNVGFYLRELGRYDQAQAILQQALEWAIQGPDPEHREVELRLRRIMAVTWRRQGDGFRAREENVRNLRTYQNLFGDDQRTWFCRSALAADHHALGEDEQAIRLASECLAFCQEHMGADHPFLHLCRVNLGVLLLSRRRDDARDLAAQGLADLRARVGDQHPWTLAAALNHANVLAADEDRPAAVARDEALLTECRDYLGEDHPYTKVAAANLDQARRAAEPDATRGTPAPVRVDIDIDIPRI